LSFYNEKTKQGTEQALFSPVQQSTKDMSNFGGYWPATYRTHAQERAYNTRSQSSMCVSPTSQKWSHCLPITTIPNSRKGDGTESPVEGPRLNDKHLSTKTFQIFEQFC